MDIGKGGKGSTALLDSGAKVGQLERIAYRPGKVVRFHLLVMTRNVAQLRLHEKLECPGRLPNRLGIHRFLEPLEIFLHKTPRYK